MGIARKVLLFVASALLLFQVALLILGRYSGLLMLAILALAVVNYFLWRRDEAFYNARDAEASTPTAPSSGQP